MRLATAATERKEKFAPLWGVFFCPNDGRWSGGEPLRNARRRAGADLGADPVIGAGKAMGNRGSMDSKKAEEQTQAEREDGPTLFWLTWLVFLTGIGANTEISIKFDFMLRHFIFFVMA